MPIIEVHLVDGMHTSAQHEQLLKSTSARYAEVLECPLERVRAYLVMHEPEHWATAGVPAPAASAPFFTAFVLEGRPVEQRQRLLAAITDAVVDILGVERALVRGCIIRVHPDDWGIGGVPASAARRGEVAARAAASGQAAAGG